MFELFAFLFSGLLVSFLGEGDLQCQTVLSNLMAENGYSVAGVVTPALGGFGVVTINRNAFYARQDVSIFESSAERDYVREVLTLDEGVRVNDLGICHNRQTTYYVLQILHPGPLVTGEEG